MEIDQKRPAEPIEIRCPRAHVASLVRELPLLLIHRPKLPDQVPRYKTDLCFLLLHVVKPTNLLVLLLLLPETSSNSLLLATSIRSHQVLLFLIPFDLHIKFYQEFFYRLALICVHRLIYSWHP